MNIKKTVFLSRKAVFSFTKGLKYQFRYHATDLCNICGTDKIKLYTTKPRKPQF